MGKHPGLGWKIFGVWLIVGALTPHHGGALTMWLGFIAWRRGMEWGLPRWMWTWWLMPMTEWDWVQSHENRSN